MAQVANAVAPLLTPLQFNGEEVLVDWVLPSMRPYLPNLCWEGAMTLITRRFVKASLMHAEKQ